MQLVYINHLTCGLSEKILAGDRRILHTANTRALRISAKIQPVLDNATIAEPPSFTYGLL